MAVYTTTNLSELQFINRFDADLYRIDLKESYKKLESSSIKLDKINRHFLICSGTTPPDRVDGLTKGAVLFKTTDIRNNVLSNIGDYYRITDKVQKRMSKTQLREFDVLLNIVGATLSVIGRSSYIAELSEDGANITQAMVLLRSISNEVKPGFLFAYLNTKFAQDQIARYARPTGQYNLNLKEVGSLIVPIFPMEKQDEIQSYVDSAYALERKSRELYKQANDVLEKELGLDTLVLKKTVSYLSSFKNVETSRRFDPENCYPDFEQFVDNLPKNIELESIGSHITYCKRGKQPLYREAGLPVLNSKHIQKNNISIVDNRMAKIKSPCDPIIKFGDVLINGTGRGTIGRVAPYLIKEHNAIPDNHVTILRTKTLDPTFLSFYLNSPAGKMQVEKHQRGSSGQVELYPIDIRKFRIWDAPRGIQDVICELYSRSLDYQKESSLCFDKAICEITNFVEGAAQ